MSEFQYYEFRAIDRRLTPNEQEELQKLSSRAEITSRSFVNEYSYGDFRGNAEAVLEKYFDAFIYRANWGTNRVMFRFPKEAVDPSVLGQYTRGDNSKLKVTDKYVILDLQSNLEGGEGWIVGAGVLDRLLPVRAKILAGDLRPLYLAWLGSIDDDFDGVFEEEENEVTEPPVPPGLNKLSRSLKAWADFLRVDGDVLDAAALHSESLAEQVRDESTVGPWLLQQPLSTQQEWLLKMLFDREGAVRRQIFAAWRSSLPQPEVSEKQRRTVVQLRQQAKDVEAERKRLKAEAAEKERRRQVQERAKYLDGLVGQEDRLWKEVTKLLEAKKPALYDQTVTILCDLRDLARKQGASDAFQKRMEQLANFHKGKTALLKKVRARDLLG